MKRFLIDFILIMICIYVSKQVFLSSTPIETYASLEFNQPASLWALQCSKVIVKVIEFCFQLFYIFITQLFG